MQYRTKTAGATAGQGATTCAKANGRCGSYVYANILVLQLHIVSVLYYNYLLYCICIVFVFYML